MGRGLDRAGAIGPAGGGPAAATVTVTVPLDHRTGRSRVTTRMTTAPGLGRRRRGHCSVAQAAASESVAQLESSHESRLCGTGGDFVGVSGNPEARSWSESAPARAGGAAAGHRHFPSLSHDSRSDRRGHRDRR